MAVDNVAFPTDGAIFENKDVVTGGTLERVVFVASCAILNIIVVYISYRFIFFRAGYANTRLERLCPYFYCYICTPS
jgi:hypothetical protein